MELSRRAFIGTGLAGLPLLARAEPADRSHRACVIGHTGRGGYGHGLDLCFQKIPGVTVVAVADPDEKGRAEAQQRIGAARGYADYREMLEKERPQLVSIGMRWVENRLALVTAAAQAGAHVYMEKPMAESLEEADAILEVARKHRIQIALAHQARVAPSLLHLKKLVDQGLVGDVLEIRTRGKEDRRAGGEDMMVLGTHCMYLLRFLAGEPIWCAARVTQDGRDVTVEDRRAATEPLGPIAGDTIHASYAFAKGVQGHFASQKTSPGGRYQLWLYGSKGVVMMPIGQDPQILHLPDPSWSPGKSGARWQPLPDAPSNADPSGLTGQAASNKRIVEDLIRAAETGQPSVVGGQEGRGALEMILAVYASHLSGGRATFPLKDRRHPLGKLSATR